MKKKIFALTMALTLAVGLAACGAKETGNEIDPDLKELQDELKGETGGQSGSSVSGSSSDSGINNKEIRALIDSINADTAELYGKCGENLDWYYKDGTMVIKGSGEMWNRSAAVGPYENEFDDSNRSLWGSVTDYDNKDFKQLIVDDGVTSIGNGAFYNCGSLTDVVLADSVTSIGVFAFDKNRSWIKQKQNEREDHLVIIGKVLYDGSTASGSVTIPDGVVSISPGAFYLFHYGSVSITKVTVPESVTSIGANAFEDTPFLEQKRNEREDHLVIINGILVDGQKAEGDVIIPEGVVSISPYAFSEIRTPGMYHSKLTSVTIPDSVTSIGDGAFHRCDRLTSVTIGNGVTSIGDYAFCSCYEWSYNRGLTSVTIGNGVTSIGNSAFADCGELTSVTIPDSVTSIGNNAFANCKRLTSVTIGNGVTSIGNSAFADCEGLTSAELPSGVSLGENAFDDRMAITYR